MDVVQSLKGFSHPKLHWRPTHNARQTFSGSYFNRSIPFWSKYFAVGRECISLYFVHSKLQKLKTSPLSHYTINLSFKSSLRRKQRERKIVFKYLSSLGSSLLSFSHVTVGTKVWSCFTLHSKDTVLPLCTTAYSGCLMILVGSEIQLLLAIGQAGEVAQSHIIFEKKFLTSALPLISKWTSFFAIPNLFLATHV